MPKITRVRHQNTGKTGEYVAEVINTDGSFDALQQASETVMGLLELATTTEATAGADTERAVTPAGLAAAATTLVSAASATAAGKVELATNAEAAAEADTTRALTPANLRQGAPTVTGSLAAMFAQHYKIAPALQTATTVHEAANLSDEAQEVTTEITAPDFPRNVTIKGNVSGITGNVVVHGTNINGTVITDTIALNGATEVAGVKAFKTVTSIDLPVQVHTPTAQVETAVAAGTITGSGAATITVTAAGLAGGEKIVSVDVLVNDTAAVWAGKVRTALTNDLSIAVLFEISGADENIILTRVSPDANDTGLNIAIANDDCTGITEDASSNNTTAGVPYDTVSVGAGVKFGLPHIVANASMLLLHMFDGSTDAGSLAVDSDEIEKNLYTLAGTADGAKFVDLVYLV